MATTFTPFLKALSWVDATTGVGGVVLAPGEVLQDTVLGIRLDGDSAHALGNYQYTISVNAPAATISLADFQAAVKAAYPTLTNGLPPGNYWLNGEQVDVLAGVTATSTWGTTELAFSIATPIVVPSTPTGFTVA